jgi:hypothetical protein
MTPERIAELREQFKYEIRQTTVGKALDECLGEIEGSDAAMHSEVKASAQTRWTSPTYREDHERIMAILRRVFQDWPPTGAILPDFLQVGDDLAECVLKLANEYKHLLGVIEGAELAAEAAVPKLRRRPAAGDGASLDAVDWIQMATSRRPLQPQRRSE